MPHVGRTVASAAAASLAVAVLTSPVALAHDPAASDDASICGQMPYRAFETQADAPASIVSAENVEGATVSDADNAQYRRRSHSQGAPIEPLETLPDHCKLSGYVAPHVRFELFLPRTEAWNGKFLLASCDGFCGKMASDPAIPGLVRGYATLSTDGGHTGRHPFDAVWGFDNRSAEIDFGHRANHVLAQAGKAIVESFYGRAPDYSYTTGFSKGGLAGVVAAQRYPEDFDGILARGPVIDYQGRNAFSSPWIADATYDENDQPILLASRADLIHEAVVAACDADDGLEDHLISNPTACDFDPATLACADGAATDACLTPPEVGALAKLYAPPTAADGSVLFPAGQEYGSEPDWPGFILPIDADHPSYSRHGAEQFLKYLAFDEDPGSDYDWRSFDPLAVGDSLAPMAEVWDADSPDLTDFRNAGGKIILVHGWADGAIAARATALWFDDVVDFMGGRENTAAFARLYLPPGVKHGSGGPGPDIYDALSALEAWVERGEAPDALIFRDEEDGVTTRARPVYPYPLQARWDGAGDPNAASSFGPWDPAE